MREVWGSAPLDLVDQDHAPECPASTGSRAAPDWCARGWRVQRGSAHAGTEAPLGGGVAVAVGGSDPSFRDAYGAVPYFEPLAPVWRWCGGGGAAFRDPLSPIPM